MQHRLLADPDPVLPTAERPPARAEASRTFAQVLPDPVALQDTIVREVAESLGDACALRLLTEDGQLLRTTAFHHADPDALALLAALDARALLPAGDIGSGEVLRTGRPTLLPAVKPGDLPPFSSPRLRAYVDRFPLHGLIAVPLHINGQLAGTLVATRHRPGVPYGPDDVRRLEALADRAGLALHNARLLSELQVARTEAAQAAELASRLHAMLSAFVKADTPRQVAEIIISQGFDALQANAGVVAVFDPRGEALDCLSSRGYPGDFPAHLLRHDPASVNPLLEAARSGEPIWLESRAEYLARFPGLAPEVIALGRHALACLPLSVEGRLMGALAFGLDHPHPFSAHERAFALTLARQCAQALERVQLLEVERQTKEEVSFLARASTRLGESLDLKTTLATLASLVVPSVAELFAVHLATPEGALSLELVAHAERSQEPRLAAVLRGLGRALIPRGPELERATSRMRTRLRGAEEPPDPEGGTWQALDALAVSAWLTVPLRSRGRALGVLSLGRRTQAFSPRQVEVAEELGRRAALALDNAWLYELELRSHQRAERLLERSGGLQQVTAAVSRALTPGEVAAVVVRRGLAILGARSGAAWTLSPDGQWLELLRAEHLEMTMLPQFRRMSVSVEGPIPEAVRRRIPVWVESGEEYAVRYPAGAPAGEQLSAGVAIGCLPLEADNRVFGVLAFGFATTRRFSEEDRGFLEVLAGICAQALERARLYEAERRSRERLTLLASASELLASSLDYETTLNNIAGLSLPALADFGYLDVVGDDGEVRRISRALRPHTQKLLEATRWTRSEGGELDLCALSSGRSALHPDIDNAWIQKAATSPEHLALLQELAPCSLVTVPLLSGGQQLGALTLCFAESGRHHTPEELQLAEELARRAAAAVENARLFHQAQQAIRLRDDFLSIAGHELNTPLTALKIHVDSLRFRPPTPDQITRKLEKASNQIGRLAKLVTALLDVSRITADRLKLERQPVDLAQTVREVAGRLADELARSGSGLRLHAEDAVVGRWDSLRLDQVVTNLLTNAIKYGQGRDIDVSVRSTPEAAVLRVQDRGIGIPPEHQGRLFQRFERAVSSRHYGGFGLGLWIVKQVVEAHGGRIQVQSEPGNGSTFLVELPREAAPAGP